MHQKVFFFLQLFIICLLLKSCNSSSVNDFIDKGISLGNSGDTKGAIDEFNKAIKLDPKNSI
jgi:Flp pilus assembly protein TadD